MTGCCTAQRFNSFHPAVSFSLGGMNARGGVAAPPRNEHAPGYFPAEHHWTAKHQDHAEIRTRCGLREQWSLRSLITGAREFFGEALEVAA
jgi:hypothetical protein